jgi:hypothetical protein
LQCPHQFGCFIGSNSSGNADRDLHGSDCNPCIRLLADFNRRRDGPNYVCRIGVYPAGKPSSLRDGPSGTM